jgi:hypothetical protein
MIPTTPSSATKSAAERRLFTLLESAEIGRSARCFHSLNLSEHDYKRWGEADFVVVSAAGLLVLEVKGGRVSCRDGLWTFTDRFNEQHHSSEGPFHQARSAMYALAKLLEERLGKDVRQLPFGWGVVFPDVDFDVSSVEWPEEVVLDARKLKDRGAGPWLEDLLGYWGEKAHKSRDASSKIVEDVTRSLRPDFDRVPSLRARADQLFTMMEQLTKDQYARFDIIEQAPRVLCEGGAGTGKTFLAAEVARREAARGLDVLFTCKSETLAAFVRSRLADTGVEVVAFDDADAKLRCASLIVDEGQDLLNLDALAKLDGLVDGGLAEGRWRIFYDGNNQSAIFDSFDREAVDVLRAYGAVPAHLGTNCRNTNEIALATKLTTGADIGVASVGSGPPIHRVFFSSRDEETGLLARHLDDLAAAGVDPGDVTILSPLPFSESCAVELPRRHSSQIVVVDAAVAARWPVRQMTFARIEDFKGMENQFVAVVDIAALSATERDLSIVYVGMTRARTGLWVAMAASLEPELLALSERHLPLLDEEPANAYV